MKSYLKFVAVLGMPGFLVITGCGNTQNESMHETTQSVRSSELRDNVTIIGRTGKPLGKVLQLRARIDKMQQLGYELKRHEFVLRVLEVDGVKLNKPVFVAAYSNGGEVPENQDVIVHGYETGEFRNYPPEVFQKGLLGGPENIPKQAGPYDFYTYFVIVKM